MISFGLLSACAAVLAYLVMFRLEELGMGHFKRLVNTQHTGKMHKVGMRCGTIEHTSNRHIHAKESCKALCALHERSPHPVNP